MSKKTATIKTEESHYINSFHRKFVRLRAERINGFVFSRGYRKVRQRGDKTGVSFAFWVPEERL